MDVTAPPLSADRLDRARLRLKRNVPMHGIGQHLRRRVGQSLEFRDFRDYQMGDDIRLVDWRASLRAPHMGKVVRVFEAEERMTLVIIVDARPAMRLPEGQSKLLYALWTLRSLAEVAAASGDEVVLGTIFSARDMQPVAARGRAVPALARQFCEDLWAEAIPTLGEIPVCNTQALQRCLRPASAVVLLSDLLFEDRTGQIARFLVEAQTSWRQVFVQRLDSVETELTLARKAGRIRLAAVEGQSFDEVALEIDDAYAEDARARIGAYLAAQMRRWAGPGLTIEPPIHWPLNQDRDALRRIFARDFLNSGLFKGIAARGGAR